MNPSVALLLALDSAAQSGYFLSELAVIQEIGSGGVWLGKDSEGLARNGLGNHRRFQTEGLLHAEEQRGRRWWQWRWRWRLQLF
ncbi:hypothetical protein SLE2022_312080 [Rubroshorea leprosula]